MTAEQLASSLVVSVFLALAVLYLFRRRATKKSSHLLEDYSEWASTTFVFATKKLHSLSQEEVDALNRDISRFANSEKPLKSQLRRTHLTLWTIQVHQPQAPQRARMALDVLSALIPKRVSDEEIGDALEFIARMEKENCSKWLIYLKTTTTYFWVITHTLLHYAERIAGILKAATGKGDGKSGG